MSIHKTLLYAFCLFFLATGFAHAVLVSVEDSYGIPVSRLLQVEAFGVLDNDTVLVDDQPQPAGENSVTATLHTDVTKGTLSCPGVGPGLCPNGSFEYTPGPGFDGFDSFQYQAVSISETSPPTTVNISACSGGPDVYTCWLEASYLAKLSELGHNNTFVESFEGVVWDVARLPSTAPSVQSKGITWTTNHPGTNEISTGSGPVRTGVWAVFDPNHGVATGSTAECDVDNPPVHCLPYDGFSGSMPGPDVLYGVGGYISGFTGANVDIILDGTPHNVGKVTGPGHHFMGVIDTARFNAFEFRELDGKVGQFLYIFGDDFIITSSGAVDVNNPPLLVLLDDLVDPPEPVVSPLIVNENEWLSILLTATDQDDGDSWSFSVSDAPAGSSLEDNFDGTATFSWTPDYTQAGDYPLTFTVTDNGIPAASASESIIITVVDVNRPPELSPIGDQSVNENTLLSILLTASDPDGNNLSFVVDTLPTGSSFVDHNNGTATFSWTPVPGQAGDYPMTFTVTDNGTPVASDFEAIIITVIDPTILPAGSLQFSSPSYSVAENGVSASITVTRTNGSFGTVGVDYASADGSAMAGSDYTVVSGSLSFADGVVSQTFSVDIIDDADYEGDESLSLTLSNPTGGAGLGAPALAILTISEDDPVSASGSLQFSTTGYNVTENGTTATITVTRVGGSFGIVGVDYASADGSATAGSDYTAVSASLSFPDGVVSQAFNVAILDDTTYEGDETLSLTLSKPTGGAGLGTPGTASLVVIENEIFLADSASEPVDTDVSTGGGSSSVDLITLIIFISLGLYRRNLRIRRYGLHHVSR